MPDIPNIANFYPDITTVSNACLHMTVEGTGAEGDPFEFEGIVQLSEDPGNLLECRVDGLYASGGAQGFLNVQDSSGINLSLVGDGSPNQPYILTAAPFISPDVGNALEVRPNGLFATASNSSVGAVVGNSTACIEVSTSGSGTVADPILVSAAPIISEMSGNTLQCREDGLFVESGRDVYIFQASGLPTPSPSKYYLWVNGIGYLYKASTNRESWSMVNTDIRLIKNLTVSDGTVTVPYQTSTLQSDGIVVTDTNIDFRLTVNSNITTWIFAGAASSSDFYRHKARVVLKYDGTPRTITYPSSWRWARKTGGLPHVAPAPTATMDIVLDLFSDDGGITQYANWDYYGTAANQP